MAPRSRPYPSSLCIRLSKPSPPPGACLERRLQGRGTLTTRACIPCRRTWFLGILGPKSYDSSPFSVRKPPPPPHMSVRAPTPSLLMGGSSPLVTLLVLLHVILPCPSCPFPPSLCPPQLLTAPTPRSFSRIPLPRSNNIIFSLGLFSAHIYGQVVVRLPVVVDATRRTNSDILIYLGH